MNKKGKIWKSVLLIVVLFVIVMVGYVFVTPKEAGEETANIANTVIAAAPTESAGETVATGDAIVTTEPTATPQVLKMTWKKKKSSLKAGKKVTFQVKVTGAGKTVKATDLTWSVSNKKYATISKKGVLTGKRAGKVTVKAKYAGKSVSCKVTIKPKQVIGIDPGHQQSGDSSLEPVGPGASTKKAKVAGGTGGVSSKVPEYKLTLTIGKALKKELVNRGYAVVMTRSSNAVNISNKERAQKINKSGADICIRLHADGGAASAVGASGLYPSGGNPYVGNLSKKSHKLSKCVLSKYCAATGIRNRGSVQRDDLTGTNWSTVPVIVLEMGFMTNSKEDLYMQSKKGQKAMVKGIANGIDAYYK